jgi:outer membrane protein TolC
MFQTGRTLTWQLRGLLFVGIASLTACTTAPIARVERDVRQIARPHLGTDVIWRRDTAQDAAAAVRVEKLAASPVSADVAVEIALLANPDAQLAFEDVGVARAEYLVAALPPNFIGKFSIRKEREGDGRQREFGLVTDLLALLQLPARRRSAGFEFEAAQLEAADRLIGLAVDVRTAHARTVTAERVATLRAEQAEVGRLLGELAERYYSAGNITRAEQEEQRLFGLTATQAAEEAQSERLAAREEFLRLLGVTGRFDQIELADVLPSVATDARTLADHEARALRVRPELRAAKRRVEARLAELSRTKWFRFTPHIEAGYSREREPDGAVIAGPVGSVELPLFNAGQAAVAAQDSVARQALRQAEALALDIRKQVRLAFAARSMARAKEAMWRERGVEFSSNSTTGKQLEYNFMLVGPFDPLHAKHTELDARAAAAEALRDYWIADLELERASGGLATWQSAGGSP